MQKQFNDINEVTLWLDNNQHVIVTCQVYMPNGRILLTYSNPLYVHQTTSSSEPEYNPYYHSFTHA